MPTTRRAAIKTLHLTNAYHPSSGGIRTFYRALLAQAVRDERDLVLVVPGDVDGVEHLSPHVRIRTLASRRSPVFDRRYRLLLPDSYLPAHSSRLAAVLAEERPDLVEVCDKYTLPWVAAMLRAAWFPATIPRPTLVALSCERMDDNVAAFVSASAIGRRFSRWYLRHLYGPAFDAHVANSEYTANELRQALWDRPPATIRTSVMGVDFAQFGPVHANRELRRALQERTGGDRDSVLLLYAGRMSPEKNVWLLLEMLAPAVGPRGSRRWRTRLSIGGRGRRPPGRAFARHAARRFGSRVLWLGDVPDRAALAALYASVDVFVHPNPREPFGIGPLEAMASRVPVVLPSAGGVLSYATPANSWLAAPDPAAFAHAVRCAVLQPDPARLVAARETARRHDWPASRPGT
jgi:alpha-1,6-mannosyltransferase